MIYKINKVIYESTTLKYSDEKMTYFKGERLYEELIE